MVADRSAREALASFEALGASRWTAQLDSHPAADVPVQRPSLDVLTPAERRILDHVARGLTNQQVASRLGVSVRTVANHLYRTYTKLGVSSRTEAALLVASQGRGAP